MNRKCTIIFVVIFLIAGIFCPKGLARNIASPDKPSPEQKSCIDCFDNALSDLYTCADGGRSEFSCRDEYEHTSSKCKAEDFCKNKSSKWDKNHERPLGTGGVFGVKVVKNLTELPLEERKLMIQNGATNIPAPELNESNIKELERERDQNLKKRNDK